MRNIYLVAYDITENSKRTHVFNKLKGYGEALQFSVFRCTLSPTERLRLRSELWEIIDHSTDRILLVDLGPDDGRGRSSVEVWGKPLVDPAAHSGILVI